MKSIIAFILILYSGVLLGQTKPLIVNIDNPQFRKLIMAVPKFSLGPSAAKNEVAKRFADEGPKLLESLLQYSGLFNLMSEAGYAAVAKAAGSFSGDVSHAPWKAIGVESLTVGHISMEGENLVVEIKNFDVTRNKNILGKKYQKVGAGDLTAVMRRVGDLILKAYTGKPGIFNTKITFIGRRSKQDEKQVFVCDFDGSNLIQITSAKAPHVSPSFSPDGRYITFTSFEQGNPDLYIYELKTGNKRKLSGYKGINSGGSWAKNGKLIAYTGSVSGDAEIYVISPTGGRRKLLIRGSGLDVDPKFSPDGKWIAFVSGRFGNPHIFRGALSWTGEDQVRVTSDKRLTYAGWYNATPAWSPDSDKIVFAGYDKDIDRFDLFMMNPDGTMLERLTIRAGDNESPSWAPNGQLIVFHSNRVGTQNIKGRNFLYVMNRDGSGQRKIETGLYDSQTPHWSRGDL